MAVQPYEILPASAIRPEAEAVRCGDDWLSWANLEMRARRFANGLRVEGVGPGEVWSLLAKNRMEWVEAALGNGRNGSRYVPLNWHLTVPELSELLVDSGASVLMVDPSLESLGREAAASAGVNRIIVLGPDYEEWLHGHSDAPLPVGPLGSPLQYTGGTTGRSKGVVRPDLKGSAIELPSLYGAWGELTGMPADDHILLCTPAYHALGAAVLRASLARGNRLDILDGWSPGEALRTIHDRSIAGAALVPTQLIQLLKQPEQERRRHDISSIKWILHTAASCPPWVKRGMIEWFGPVVVELYGSAEGIGPVIATSSDWLERPGTVGRATSAIELSIVDDQGMDLPAGEVGTIYAKRRDGSPEYFGDSEKTALMLLPDGRFTVGDLGWLDEDGFLFLAGRRVDLIITGGTNVYPAEVEAVLSQHPSIADVAVFGIPDKYWGQQVKAVVEVRPGLILDESQVIAYAAERLAPFKVPKSVDIVDSLPREASGKLRKHLLSDPYWEGSDVPAELAMEES
ncbi:MAG: AMP-binding protein [Actinomycetota bacterium]|nr:AMP-binding protein [Actinomycetota bacterium]